MESGWDSGMDTSMDNGINFAGDMMDNADDVTIDILSLADEDIDNSNEPIVWEPDEDIFIDHTDNVSETDIAAETIPDLIITPDMITEEITGIDDEIVAEAASLEDKYTEQTDALYAPEEFHDGLPIKTDTSEDVDSWLGEINPNYDPYELASPFNENCGACALAVDSRLNGDMDAVASIENVETIEEMNELTGMEQVSMSPDEIRDYLIAQGPGSHGIVGIDRVEGPGHWFNALYDGEKVVAIDGQTNEKVDWPPNDLGDVVNWDFSVKKENN